MISNLSFSFISFINFFLIPFISLRIYTKRHSIEWTFTADNVFYYILLCVLNLPLTRLFTASLEKITSSIYHAESTKYTLVAMIAATLLPLIIEIVEKYIKIKINIEPRKHIQKEDINHEK